MVGVLGYGKDQTVLPGKCADSAGAGAVLAFCAVLPVMFAATAVPTGSWGLSFRTEGQPPVGNATAGALRQYDAVYVGDTEEKGDLSDVRRGL